MIKYIILTTSLFTITIFDGNMTIYIAKGIDLTQQYFDLNVSWLSNVHGSTTSFIDATRFGHFDPPKSLKSINSNNLIPFFNNYVDIVNIYGRRPNIIIFNYYQYILNNTPVFIGGFVILALSIQNLLHKYINIAKGYIFNFLFFLEKSIARKKDSKYLTDKFLKYINLNFIAEHLRDFKIYMGRSNKLTAAQDSDPEMTRLWNNRISQSQIVQSASRTVQIYVDRLLTLINENNLTVYNIEGNLTITSSNNLTPERLEEINHNFQSWFNEVARSIGRMTNGYSSLVNFEAEIRIQNAAVRAIDLSVPIARANEAYARLLSQVVRNVTEDEKEEEE